MAARVAGPTRISAERYFAPVREGVLVLGPWSAPEPDVAWVTGSHRDYSQRHPETAFLVVEASEWWLHQDRRDRLPAPPTA